MVRFLYLDCDGYAMAYFMSSSRNCNKREITGFFMPGLGCRHATPLHTNHLTMCQ